MSRKFSLEGKQIFSLASIGCLIAIFLVGCDRAPKPTPEIRIGLIAPFVGTAEETTGKPTLQGAKLAIKEVNDAGGLKVNGVSQKIVLIVKDNKDNPDDAVAVATTLINQEKVVAIVGLPRSRSAIPVANVAERAGIPLISSTSTHPDTTANKKYAFRIAYTDDFQGQVIATFAARELGMKKAALLYDIATEYSRDLSQIFTKEFESLSGKVVASESYTTDQQSFRNQLENIRQSQAELLLLPNYAEEVANQAQQIRELGLEITLIGGDSWGAVTEDNYPNLEGSFFAEVWTPDIPNAATKDFVPRYTEVYNEEPNANSALTYDAINLVFQAIKSQDKADPESIRQGLANTKNYPGVSGNISYQGTGDPVKSVVIVRVQNGKRLFYKEIKP